MGVCEGHRDAVSCLTHESNFLFSGSDDTSINAWDLHVAQRTLGTPSHHCCVFFDDVKYGIQRLVQTLMSTTQMLAIKLDCPCYSSSRCSRRYKAFQTGHDSISLLMNVCWLLHAGTAAVLQPLFTLQGHYDPVSAVSMLPHPGQLLSCDLRGLLISWDYVAQRAKRKFQHSCGLLCLAPRADKIEEILIGTSDGDILRLPFAASSPVRPSTSMNSSRC